MRSREVFYSGVILSISAFMMRTVSVGFNVYISGRIGAAGMGLLSLIMSVYSLAVTFAVSGISLASTRLVSEADGVSRPEQIKPVMRKCFIYSMLFGTITMLVLLFGAEHIGGNWLGDSRSIKPLKMLALSMPCLSMSCAMNGYFTALRRVIKTSVAQFFEQLARIIMTVLFLDFLGVLDGGLSEYERLENACMAIISSGTIAEIGSFVFSFILYKYDLSKNKVRKKIPCEEHKDIKKKMLRISLPVAFSAYIRTGLVTLEHMLIPRGLTKFGASKEGSFASYGVLQGMVLPIVLFPNALLSSFNLLMIPELSAAAARGEKRHISYMSERVIRFTMLFSIGVSAIMICFSHELGYVIYNSHSAANYIKLVAPLAPMMFLDSAVDSLLKGLDEQLYNMKINIIDAAVSAALVYFLCPKIGIMGYIVTIFASEIFNLACSITRLTNIIELKLNLSEIFIKPMVCALAACTFTRVLLEASNGMAYSYFSLILHILLAIVMYVLIMLLTSTLSKEDCSWIKKTVLRH